MSPATLMTEEEAIQRHLTALSFSTSVNHFSGFVAALRDMRGATGRNPDTGEKISGQGHGNWLGATGYLMLLDQIGSCFKPRSSAGITGNTIHKALGYFTQLPDREIDALYALRCAFAHDYSLYNIPPNGRQSLQHHFVVWEGSGPLIRFPNTPWNGDYNNQTNENATWVNLEALGDLVEQVYRQLLNLAAANQLDIALGGGADELVRRYSFVAVRLGR
jgi:hypothetical protein